MKRDKDKTAKVFGEVLKELRVGRGYSQDKLAELAGTERSHISSIERAEKLPLLKTILVLANALDITAGQLITTVEDRLKAISTKE